MGDKSGDWWSWRGRTGGTGGIGGTGTECRDRGGSHVGRSCRLQARWTVAGIGGRVVGTGRVAGTDRRVAGTDRVGLFAYLSLLDTADSVLFISMI